MSAPEWTPGPWWMARNEFCFAVGHGDKELAYVGQTDRCSVNLNDISKANARLIAAAPEMFEALRELVAACEVATSMRDHGPAQTAMLDTTAARSALSRATGGGNE